MKKTALFLNVLFLGVLGCNDSNHKNDSDIVTHHISTPKNKWTVKLDELSDEEYPSNPDISIRHSKALEPVYSNLELIRNKDSSFTFTFVPKNNTDTIVLADIKLMEWIPTVCQQVKKDDYLTEIAVVNQEWNRHQVKFTEGQFLITGDNPYGIKRVDLARNCLNAYLWELITYAEEDGKLKPFYHAWFNFPKDLYAELFEERNGLKYGNYSHELEDWIDPESKPIDFNKLRTVKTEKEVKFENLNHQEYPLLGERKKKYINIIYPKNTTVINDFLTDSTEFATFSPPGFYNPKDPRKTKLSLLKYPNKVIYRTIDNNTFEIEVDYLNTDSSKTTKLVISGLKKEDIPTLSTDEINKGWMNSMGFGNHTFYETYEHYLENSSKNSNYFAVLVDQNNKWLDSHFVGIDGPLLYWDKNNPNLLHLWILSFERHAFVGHYLIDIERE
jgi:hypothetical protein